MSRFTLAIPSKGRLRDPSWSLLEAAGLYPQEPGERSLVATCLHADVDILFVRAGDVPEYVQDGVVDCGITGRDLVEETECAVEILLPLNFGHCTLVAAVPSEDSAATLADIDGRRIATALPRLAAKTLANAGFAAELVAVAGAAEIAPRLGLADAIIDLVSSGSTLKTNGLRSIGTLFESEAVLISRPDAEAREAARTLTMVLGSVVAARANRYLLFNVPTEALESVSALLPTSGSPTVLPLASPGLCAVHALVPAHSIWQLLPQLERLGATSLITLPVERMVR